MIQRKGNKKHRVKEFTNTYNKDDIIDLGGNLKSIDYPVLGKVYRKPKNLIKDATDFSLINDCQYSGSGWSKNIGIFFNQKDSTCYSKRCQGVYCCKNYWLEGNDRCMTVLSNTANRDKICHEGHGSLIRSTRKEICDVMIYLIITPDGNQHLLTLGNSHNHPDPPPTRTPQHALDVITQTVDMNPRVTVDQLVLGESMSEIPSSLHISLQNRTKLAGLIRHRFQETYGQNHLELVKKVERTESTRT